MAGRKARRGAGRASRRYAAVTTAGRSYPLHTNIISTTFWVGELFNPVAADGSQVCSTYDSQWAYRWSGVNNGSVAGAGTDCAGAPLGGCDGVPSGSGASFACATEARTAANNYFPTSSSVHPQENPFYLDLPFDDLNDSIAYNSRASVIPWANDVGFAGNATNTGFSYMKNRWVKLMKGAAVCYAQIQDAGPGQYHDSTYVFGSGDARPASASFNNAGMDVSPAVNGCLGFASLDGQNDLVSWQFVDAVDVPLGPWTQVVTYSQVEGADGGATYNAAICPPGAASPTAMPVGNLTNWTQTYTQDFTTPAALGTVDTVYSANMSGYTGFTDTSGLGTYDPETVLSVHDSTLDYFIHTDGTTHKVAAPIPMGYTGQTYGRYAVRWRADNLPGYKVAFLMWPSSDVWNEGEIDWPEQHQLVPGEKPRLASAMRGTYHTALFSMAFDPAAELFAATDSTGWHVDVIEWTPGLVRAIRDGVEVGRTTIPGKVPTTAMRWTLQAETNLVGAAISNATNGHILVDWLAAYSWTGPSTFPTINGASEAFTGTSGGWPSPKWAVNAQGGSVALSSNTGRMLPAAGAYAQGPCATLEGTDPLYDQEVYVEANLTSNAEKYAYLAVRTSGYNASYYPTDGYMLRLQPSAGNYQLCRGNGGSAPTTLATVTHTYTAGTTQKVRLRVAERTINAKVWQGIEPAGWDTTFTDSAVQYLRSGKVQLALTPGAGAAEAITWNNLTVTPTVTALTEDFSGFTIGDEWTEGSVLGAWRCQYLGTAGYAKIVDAGSGNKALELKATATTGTTSTLLTSVNRFGSPTGIKITGRMRTLAQTGTTPNDWECAWLFWHYNDRSGVADDGTGAPNDTIRQCYYLSLKPQAAQATGGWELGKLDQSLFSGGQRFLASAGSANYPVGTAWRYFEVTTVPATAPDGTSPGVSITVKAGNSAGALTTLTTFVDGPGSLGFQNWSVNPTQQIYTSGSVGLYHEDAQVQFDDLLVTAV